MMWRRVALVGCGLLLCSASWAASRVEVISSFETPDDLAAWDISAAGTKLVAEGATHGKQALDIAAQYAGGAKIMLKK